MLFTFLAAAAASQTMAMRPQLGRSGRTSANIAHVAELVSKISNPGESLAALQAASGTLAAVLVETGNATDHISGEDAELLGSVVTLVEKEIYSSMDLAHEADVAALAAGIDTASQCNINIAARQAPDGDLGHLHSQVQEKQQVLDTLQENVNVKTEINTTKYGELDSHMQMIAPPPVCPGLPERNMPSLDLFFAESEYSIWFAAQQASYTVVRDAFVVARDELDEAIHAYEIQLAIRNTQYCDWSSELEAACVAFDTCFADASNYYTGELTERVTVDMNGRIQVKTAGDTLIHQVKFLLAEVADQQTPPVDTSRYEIAFPSLPPKGLCDLSPLDAAEWVPMVQCDEGAPGPGKP